MSAELVWKDRIDGRLVTWTIEHVPQVRWRKWRVVYNDEVVGIYSWRRSRKAAMKYIHRCNRRIYRDGSYMYGKIAD